MGSLASRHVAPSAGAAEASPATVEPRRRSRARWLWLGYLGAGAVTVGAYYLAPAAGGWVLARLVARCGLSATAAGAVFAGVLRFRPRPRTPWLLIGVAQMLNAGGDVVFYGENYLGQVPPAFPGLGDVFYLAHYPVLVAGLLWFARRRAPGGDLPGLLDGLLVATAAATLSFVHLVEPALDENLSPRVAMASVSYPIADVVLLTIGVRLLLGGGRPPAFILLAASLGAELAADTGHAFHLLGGGFQLGGPVDGAWLAATLLIGAAALHPTMTRLSEPRAHPPELGRWRLCALYFVGIVAPLTLVSSRGRADAPTELCTAAAVVVSTALIMLRMRQAEVRQRRLANTDVLTSLFTRRYLDRQLALAATRPAGVMALLLVDVDRFKSVNDRYGHPAGDRVLAEVARRLRDAARSGDIVARYGGEEFALVLTRVEQEDLRAVGERMRASVAAEPVLLADGVALPVTVSVGAAHTEVPASPAELVDRADRALYEAKESGRDQVVVADRAARSGSRASAVAPATADSRWWPSAV
jgi:diguanylate cyclase (GGDEF)-like protein